VHQGARAHEPSHASVKVALVSLAILGAVLLAAVALMAVLLLGFDRADPMKPPVARTPPPAPRLEVVPGATLAEVNRVAARRLETWGWSNRAAGLAHVPIERAMQLQARRGWSDPEPTP
jgi:hypothetical protein